MKTSKSEERCTRKRLLDTVTSSTGVGQNYSEEFRGQNKDQSYITEQFSGTNSTRRETRYYNLSTAQLQAAAGCYNARPGRLKQCMNNTLKIINIVGARPNFPKIAPLIREMRRHPEIEPILVHTGQHYDEALSEVFFRQMGIPAPDINLEVGSGSHAAQTAEILKRIEPVLIEQEARCRFGCR